MVDPSGTSRGNDGTGAEGGGALEDLRFDPVGPGRVGTSLAHWLAAAGARPGRVAGRSAEAALPLATALGATPVAAGELRSSETDLLLLAVPDPVLGEVARTLAQRPRARVALHVAGSRGGAAIAALAGPATAVGSLHPLKAFPRSLPDPAEARGVFFAVDGEPAALALARRIAAALGGVPGEIPHPARPLYHFAASVAAGGATTLVALAAELGEHLELAPELHRALARGYLGLARGALEGAARSLGETAERAGRTGTDGSATAALASAITGPLARGETDLFLAGLDRLGAGPVAELVARLGAETVRLTHGPEAADDLARRRAASEPPRRPSEGRDRLS